MFLLCVHVTHLLCQDHVYVVCTCDTFVVSGSKTDPVARKLRLRRRRDGQESDKVLKVREYLACQM